MEQTIQYTPIERTIHISCDMFGGFKATLDVGLFSCKQQLILWVINLLEVRLHDLGLEILERKLQERKHLYHIHDYDMGEILLVNRPYYICNHNCDNNE